MAEGKNVDRSDPVEAPRVEGPEKVVDDFFHGPLDYVACPPPGPEAPR